MPSPPSAANMSQVTQFSNGPSQPSPIIKVPPEIIMEIFKFAVLSSEGARSRGVKALCLVDKHWNDIANATPDLWTKITLAYPFRRGQLSAAQKWLRASEPKIVDVEIDFCDPTWHDFRPELSHPFFDPAPLGEVVAAATSRLHGSEHRWRSISIKSNIEEPIYQFLGAWVIPSLPALESIDLKMPSEMLGGDHLRTTPRQPDGFPVLFGGNGTLVPKLREVSICGVHLNWPSATAIAFRNLRKLEMKNQSYVHGPTIQQFSALIAASPGLENLDVSGYCPAVDPTQTPPPLVRLPALKNLVFAWARVEPACQFLMMLQISETLETLSLVDTEVGLGIRPMGNETPELIAREYLGPRWIFELLAILGSKEHKDNDPSGPRISMCGLKSLSLSWTCIHRDVLYKLLENAPAIEEIRLTDVCEGVTKAIMDLVESRSLPSLRRVYLRWVWRGGSGSGKAHLFIERLQNAGVEVIFRKCDRDPECSTPIGQKAQLVKQDAAWA